MIINIWGYLKAANNASKVSKIVICCGDTDLRQLRWQLKTASKSSHINWLAYSSQCAHKIDKGRRHKCGHRHMVSQVTDDYARWPTDRSAIGLKTSALINSDNNFDRLRALPETRLMSWKKVVPNIFIHLPAIRIIRCLFNTSNHTSKEITDGPFYSPQQCTFKGKCSSCERISLLLLETIPHNK